MKIPVNKTGVALRRIKQVPRVMASRAFLIILLLILSGIMTGVFLCYYYIVLAEQEQPIAASSPATFNNEAYKEILKYQQKRQQNFDDFSRAIYQNPFTPAEQHDRNEAAGLNSF